MPDSAKKAQQAVQQRCARTDTPIFSPVGVPMLEDTKLIGSIDKKIDSDALVMGQPVYTGDQLPAHCLHLALARSPHAFARVLEVDASEALELEGVVAVYSWKDVPPHYFTSAGQTAPEPSPQDRRILDEYVRFVGDPAAIVVAESPRLAKEALSLLKISYEKLPAVLDPEEALDNEVCVHPENPHCYLPQEVGSWDFKRNLVGAHKLKFGRSFEDIVQESDYIVEETFYTKPQAHVMMETYRAFAQIDQHGRLHIVSSTQVPFHAKRQVATALGISPSKVRVIKPRIGGGFGGKQTTVAEFYVAFVSWVLRKPCYLELSRQETFAASNTRHAIRVKVSLAASKEGKLRGIKIDALSDQGAYGEHAWTTLGHVGRKSMPLYSSLESAEFHAKVVYTNKVPAGAFRGYGAVQGIYAVESAVSILCQRYGFDPVEFRRKNMVKQGDTPVAYGDYVASCGLPECLDRVVEMIGYKDFDEGRPLVHPDGTIESVGIALAQQGSGIAGVDTSTVAIRLNESGDYTLLMSPTDNGTGCDTVLTKMAAEVLDCDMSSIATLTADTDVTPYDPGSYASSSTYVTGGAVIKAAAQLKAQILKAAAKELGLPESAATDGSLVLRNNMIYREYPQVVHPFRASGRETNAVYTARNTSVCNAHESQEATAEAVGLSQTDDQACKPQVPAQFMMRVQDLGIALSGNVDEEMLFGTASHGSPVSPAPYMAGAARILYDPKTGMVKVKKYAAAVDCGTVMSKNLALVQVEGGIVQSLGYALSEDTHFSEQGKMRENSLMNYRLPTRCDYGPVEVEFVETYEPTGPFGAKSIGELVSDTPAPALFAALNQAMGGCCPTDLPLTPPKLWMAQQRTLS